MEGVAIWRTGMRRAVATCQHHQQSAQRCIAQTQRRFYASPTQSHSRPQGQAQDEIKAAPQIDFQDDRDQFARPRTQILSTSRQSRSRGPNNNANRTPNNNNNTRTGGRGPTAGG
ncbi:hypothetical protein KC318_g19504, partial [Hortaea werneckii]